MIALRRGSHYLPSELSEEGKRFAVMQSWTELVVAGLDSNSRDVSQTVMTGNMANQLLGDYGWQMEGLSERMKETFPINYSLQKAMCR